MAEQITKDLEKAGSESMGSLIEMLNGYKTREANGVEEIDKLGKLTIIKDDEITDLDQELNGLNDFLSNLREKQMEKINMYKKEIKENQTVIKR